MEDKLRVAFLSPEVSPYAASGEMADVAASLPKALAAAGLAVSLFMPRYRKAEIESLACERVGADLAVPLGDRRIKARIFRTELGRFDLFLVDHPGYYWREGIYGTGKGEYLDNDERFTFFNRAVLEFLIREGREIDILHANNWATALAPVFLKTHYKNLGLFRRTASVLTLHNITFQGEFPPDAMALTGLNWRFLNTGQLAFRGRFNFLKSGLVYADLLSTVSSTYRREILTRKHGAGLEEVLRSRRGDLFAVRNAIDEEVWNPGKDPYLTVNYGVDDFYLKAENKTDLLRETGLSAAEGSPLVGIRSYLSESKGLDLVLQALPGIVSRGAALVIQGGGDSDIENRLVKAARAHKGRVAVRLNRSPALTHKLLAGADMVLIPSRYEPCGLNQLYGFRYGAVPVVHATGGLRETVFPYTSRNRDGNGFVFREYSAAALLSTLGRAVETYRKPKLWARIVRNGFATDFSWSRAARSYIRLYCRALHRRGLSEADAADPDQGC